MFDLDYLELLRAVDWEKVAGVVGGSAIGAAAVWLAFLLLGVLWRGTKGTARLAWRCVSWPFRGEPDSQLLTGILDAIASPDAAWGKNELASEGMEVRLNASAKAGCPLASDLLSLRVNGEAVGADDLTLYERVRIVRATLERIAELEAEALAARREQHLGRLNMAQAAKPAPAKPPLRGGLNSAHPAKRS